MPATQREIDAFKNSLKTSDLDYGDQEKAAWNFMQQKLVTPEFEALQREQKQQAWINFRTDMIGEPGLLRRAGEAIGGFVDDLAGVMPTDSPFDKGTIEAFRQDLSERGEKGKQAINEILNPPPPPERPPPEIYSGDKYPRYSPEDFEEKSGVDKFMETPSTYPPARVLKRFGKESLRGGAGVVGALKWLDDLIPEKIAGKKFRSIGDLSRRLSDAASRIKVSETENAPLVRKLKEEPLQTVLEEVTGFLPTLLVAEAGGVPGIAAMKGGEAYMRMTEDPRASVMLNTETKAKMIAPAIGILTGILLSSPGGKDLVLKYGESRARFILQSALTESSSLGLKTTAISVVNRAGDAMALLPEEKRIEYLTNPEALSQYLSDFFQGAATGFAIGGVKGATAPRIPEFRYYQNLQKQGLLPSEPVEAGAVMPVEPTEPPPEAPTGPRLIPTTETQNIPEGMPLATARIPAERGLPGPPGGTPTVFAESKQPRMSYSRQIPSGLVGEGIYTDEAATRTPREPRDITPVPVDEGTLERIAEAKKAKARAGYEQTVAKLQAAAEGEKLQLLTEAKSRAAREYGDSPAVSAAIEDFTLAELRDYVEGPSMLSEKPMESPPENLKAVPAALREFIPSPHDFSYLEHGTPILDQEGERTGARLPSTYPDYFQNRPNKNLTAAGAKEALRKVYDGEPLNPRELEFVKHAAEETRTAYKYTPEMLEGSEIEIGDSVTIDGEPHVAAEMDGTDILLKDHDVHRVNGFNGEIAIDRGSHTRGKKPESVDELRTRLEREKALSQGGIQLTLEGGEDLGNRPPQKGVSDLPMFGGKLDQGTPGDALQKKMEIEARQGGLFEQAPRQEEVTAGVPVSPEPVTETVTPQLFPESNRLTNINPDGGVMSAIKNENPGFSVDAAQTTIYRATVGDEIRPNDFVAINRKIASDHLRNLKDRGEKGKIISKKVNTQDLLMGNDATEFVYSPPRTKETDLRVTKSSIASQKVAGTGKEAGVIEIKPPDEGKARTKSGGGGVVLGSGLGGMWDAIKTERGKVGDATTKVYTTEKERFTDNLLNKFTHGEAIKTELGKAATGRDILSRHIGLQDLSENAAMVSRLKDREELGRAVGAIYKKRPAPFRFASSGEGKPTRYVDAADEAARIAVEIRRSESLDPKQKVHREGIPLSGVQDAQWAIYELRKEGGAQNEDTARLIEFALEIHEGKHPELKKYVNRIETEMQQLGQDLMDAGLISSILAHYSPRYWIDPKGKRGKSYQARFATKSKHAKQRVFNSYFEALRLGYRPRVRGLSNAKAEIIKEHGNTLADRELISFARNMKDAEGRPFFSIDSHGGDYKELHHPNFHDYVPSFSINLKPFKEAISYAGQEAPYKRGIPKGLDYVESVNKPLHDQLVKLLADKDIGTKNTFITQHGDIVTVFEKRKLYAPRLWANHINAMYDPSKLFDPSENAAWRIAGWITKVSSYRKSLLFSGSFFHHKALAKSYLLGTRPWEKGGTIAPWKAAKEGYEMAMAMNPIIRLGIRNGLTLFKIPEWDKEILNRQRKLMTSARKAPLSAASKTMENFTDSLFLRFQTGLKAQSFALEYKHAVDKFQKKNNRPPTDAEADEIAKASAQLINNDYGGLHWRRIGRSRTMLDLERGFIFLAPDWNESNIKTVPLVERVANHIFREGLLLAEGGQNTFGGGRGGNGGGKDGGPKMDGMDKIYLKFLSGALAYGILATILANIALNGWDDTKKRFGKTAKEIKKDPIANAKKITESPAFAWDITKIYDHMGVKHQGQRVTLMPLQQFDDPVKLMTNWKGFFKNKAAWAPGAFLRLATGRNWQDKPYLAWQEAWRTGHLTAPSKYNETEGPAYYLPTVLFDETMDVAPIPLRLMIDYQLGEVDGLTALLRESGEDVREEWARRPKRPRRPYRWKQ